MGKISKENEQKYSASLSIWVLQTGEPLHIDGSHIRPMRAINLSNALVNSGHKVILWSSAFHHQEKYHRSNTIKSIKLTNNLEIRLIPSRGYSRNIGIERLIDHAQLAFSLKKMLNNTETFPDVVFIGYPPIETAVFMVKWLKKRGIPCLLDIKDQWPVLFLNAVPTSLRFLGHIVFWPYFYLARRVMREVTGLSSMSNSFLDWALEFSGRERSDMDEIFPLTSPLGRISQLQLERARKWWDSQGILDDGRLRFCFVGSHSPAFDFKPIQKAAKMLSTTALQCEFVICGDGELTKDLKNMMKGLENVKFPGWIDHPKIEVLAERSFCAIAPYINIENFTRNIPNKIIDALSLGLPILSSLEGEVASLIKKNGIGMSYSTNDDNTLLNCIETLIHNPELHKTMSQQARELYAKRFSYDIVYSRLVKHLELMARK